MRPFARPVVLLLLGMGCASSIRSMMGQHQDETAPVTKTRDTDGVCAYIDASKSSNSSDQIMACARYNADANRAVLFSEVILRTEDPRFDPTTWNVVVTRQDGTVVLAERTLQPGQPYRVGCVYGVCMGRRGSVDALNTEWVSGRYNIRYTNELDGKTYDLSITLQ
jgi:hypothetical protein